MQALNEQHSVKHSNTHSLIHSINQSTIHPLNLPTDRPTIHEHNKIYVTSGLVE